jgi:predicted transcriptional regulator
MLENTYQVIYSEELPVDDAYELLIDFSRIVTKVFEEAFEGLKDVERNVKKLSN